MTLPYAAASVHVDPVRVRLAAIPALGKLVGTGASMVCVRVRVLVRVRMPSPLP